MYQGQNEESCRHRGLVDTPEPTAVPSEIQLGCLLGTDLWRIYRQTQVRGHPELPEETLYVF